MFISKTKSKTTSIFETSVLHIVEQTPSILKLQVKGNLARRIMLSVGIPFFLIGLSIIIFWNNLNTLKCNRIKATQVACELTTSSLLGEHITPIPTGQLRGAEVEVGRSSDSDGNTNTYYRVILLTKNSSIRLRASYSWEEDEEYRKAYQINSFIRNEELPSLIVQEKPHWLNYLFGGVFTLAGTSLILTSLILKLDTSCIFDKGSGRMYLKQKNLFKQEEIREEMLHKIKKVLVVEKTDKEGDKTYSAQLILSSGEKISLPTSGGFRNNDRIIQSINQFLGLTM